MEQPERFDISVGSAGTAGTAGTAGSSNGGDIPACLATLFNGTSGKCAGPVCHSAGAAPGGDLDLSSPGVSARLVDMNASHAGVTMGAGVTCPTAKLVDTSNRAASWLLVKINAMQGSCGTLMPQVGTLTAAEKTCITDWVNSVPASTAGGGSGGASTTGGSGGAPGTGGSGGTLATGGTSTAGGNGGAAGRSGGGNGGTAGRSSGGNGGTAGRAAGGTGGARGGASGTGGA